MTEFTGRLVISSGLLVMTNKKMFVKFTVRLGSNCITTDRQTDAITFVLVIWHKISPAEKGQKIAGGRSRVCPNFFCSLLFTGMCTLVLWIIILPTRITHFIA